MKRFKNIIPAFIMIMAIAVLSNCNGKRHPGHVYMPDMAYSRAYETYAHHDSSKFTTDPAEKGGNFIFYDSKPIVGTVKRGEIFPYTLPNDSIGYSMSGAVPNPLTSINAADLAEAGRLYNINCAICHGDKGAANGPLATSGKIGGVANLASGEKASLAEGTMFHVMTYGKNNMGSYASQLDRKQRWMITKYIRTLQQPAAKDSAKTAVNKTDSTKATTAKADSAIVKNK